jgi:DNA-directed RNA polymerase specialized sigma subunit
MYQNVRENLAQQLGRPPTHTEIAQEMHLGVGEVRRLESGSRRDLAAVESSLWVRPEAEKQSEVLDHVMYELTSQEQQVLEYVFGRNGKKTLPANEIAQKLGVTPARVSQMKKKIADIIEHHYGAHKIVQPGM